VTRPGDGDAVRGVVLDVEGTTTPVSFVYGVLFPYARARLREFLTAHGEDALVRDALALLATEWIGEPAASNGAPRWMTAATWATRSSPPGTIAELDAITSYLERLMDLDRKSTGLKIIQGEIWRGGFESGALRGEVYPDVKPALGRWRAAHRVVSIYSSGSATAQRLLFGHSTAGDLTPLIDRHFDTSVGAKRSPESYLAIARALKIPAGALLFISDVDAELVAARTAGLATRLCVRGDRAPATSSPIVHSFDEL
jgi:enolase-phosphatase E1